MKTFVIALKINWSLTSGNDYIKTFIIRPNLMKEVFIEETYPETIKY